MQRELSPPAGEGTGRKATRFLLVGPLPPPIHGEALAFEMLCGALAERGHDCWTVNVHGKDSSCLGRFTLKRSMEIPRLFARFVRGLIARHRRVYVTLSRSRAGFLRDLLMIWSAWSCGCRLVVHVHGGNYGVFYGAQPRFWRFLIRRTLRRVHRIILLSERLRGMFDFDPALQGRLTVVWNGLSFVPNAGPRGRRLDGRRPVRLLFLSNLHQSKGYFDVLEAVAALRRTTAIPLEAVFAGSFLPSVDDPAPMSPAEAEARFHEYVAAHGLGNIVRYAGPVVGSAKRRLLETSDVFVLPTRYFTEGQPLAVIEAMAHGCVVIATDYRAIPDLVVDGVTGVLIDHGRPDRIAAAVRGLVADPDRYRSMSRAAVERYEKRLTMRRHLEAMVPLLESG